MSRDLAFSTATERTVTRDSRVPTESLLSQIAFITESLLSQNRFYHRIAFITKSLLSQIRFQEGIATIELGVACLHYQQNRFYHRFAFITKSLLSQIAFHEGIGTLELGESCLDYHKIAFITNRFYHKSLLSQIRFYHKSKARPGTTVRPPRAPVTYWTTTDNTRGLLNHSGRSPDAIGSIETKSRTVHQVKSLLSQIAFITNHDQHGKCRSDLPV